jgi:hypothetical protein
MLYGMSEPDRRDPGRPRNCGSTLESQRQVRPAAHGVGSDRRFGIPEAAEEYDCMSSPLLHRQFEDMGTRSLARLINHERWSHFVL